MDWKKLTIEDKEIIDNFTKGKFKTCDYNFTNLFLWSQGENLYYKIENDVLIIHGTFVGDEYSFMPIPKDENAIGAMKGIIKDLLQNNKKIVLVPEEWKEKLEDTFILEERRDSFDYVYSIESLAYLKGRKYAKKKNRVHNFMKSYNYSYESVTSENVKKVIDFQTNWCHDKECEIIPVLRNENMGILNLLHNFDVLGIKGGILKVDGKIVAYTLGEAISDEYVVIHIEKGLNDYVGSYQMINRTFLEKEFTDYKYVNREDDFGDEGLREAKESYHPLELLKKYEITGIK
ncbi:DUF2156 domain-containing protein [Fusobacterium sp.]|uniref:DUF2156 domain-containing protein n=1 Tax=Fusobacterium sp. TaxID=68766 RepID=UPI0028FDCFCE|nr:phosphatidylglycerol lysyltransferase domain-containing protein [Fusobacterium sp.]MDU1910771.1 phosphatidylglycerol lysyltransferase domain-containing protein [Fusobacterium sp.]